MYGHQLGEVDFILGSERVKTVMKIWWLIKYDSPTDTQCNLLNFHYFHEILDVDQSFSIHNMNI